MQPNGRDSTSRAPIVLRRVQRERTGPCITLNVLCPDGLRVMNLDACRTCNRSCGLCFNAEDGEIFLRCRVDDAQPVPKPGPTHPAQTPVGSLIEPNVPLLGEDASLKTMRAHFAQYAVSAAPVAGLDGRVVGIVQKTDVARAFQELEAVALDGLTLESDRAAVPYARDLMALTVFTLDADDDIAAAAALMAYEGIHAIIVQNQKQLGALTSFEVLRWLARTREAGEVVQR